MGTLTVFLQKELTQAQAQAALIAITTALQGTGAKIQATYSEKVE